MGSKRYSQKNIPQPIILPLSAWIVDGLMLSFCQILALYSKLSFLAVHVPLMKDLVFCTPSSTSSYPERLLVWHSQPSYHFWFGPSRAFFLVFLLACYRSNRWAVLAMEFSSLGTTWPYHRSFDSRILSVIATSHRFLTSSFTHSSLTFFQSSTAQFWWACANGSLSFLSLTDRSDTRLWSSATLIH